MVGLVRGKTRSSVPNPYSIIQQEDVLVVAVKVPSWVPPESRSHVLIIRADNNSKLL